MKRTELEDEIIGLLTTELPGSVRVGSLPLGMEDRKALDVRTAAVWVVYAGSENEPNRIVGGLVQAEGRKWSVLVLAKKYRSSTQAGEAALDLLDQVVDTLAGAEVGGIPMTKLRDSVLSMPEGCGIVGYEALFSISTDLEHYPQTTIGG